MCFKTIHAHVQVRAVGSAKKTANQRLKIVYVISTCRFIVVPFKIKHITILTSDPWLLHTHTTNNKCVCMYIHVYVCAVGS